MKRNKSVLQADVAGAFLVMAAGAQAGTIGTTTQNYATEIFGTGSSAIEIQPLGINYQFGVPVAANQTLYVYVTLSNGAVFGAAPAFANFKCVDAADAPVTATAAVQVNATAGLAPTAMFTINTGGNGFNTNSVCNYNAAAPIIQNLTSSLSTSGGTVSATWAQATTASTSAVPTTGLIDAAGTHTGVILTSSPAITGTITASSAFAAVPETARISVANQDVFTGFSTNSTATVVNLGSVSFTNNPTTALDTAGVPYTIAGQASSLSGKITGAFAPGSIALSTASTCGTPGVLAAPGAPTLTATTGTFTAATKPTTAVPYYICYTPVGTAAIPATIPAAVFTLNKTAATDVADTASGNLYQLQLNGVSREVRSYIPAAAAGYTSFVRFINNTSFAAPITGQFVYVDGSTSTAAPISFTYTPVAGGAAVTGSTLPAGGSVTLTSAQIEASLGAPSAAAGGAAARPRLLITAPVAETAGLGAELTGYKTLEVQSFILTNANGNFSDATGAQ